MVKAISLYSGGLDSTLAIKVLRMQNIDVIALSFATPFNNIEEKRDVLKRVAEELGCELMLVKLGKEYLDLVRRPKYGYGKALNPCIDCKILMLKKAKEIMIERGADFIATGEVLGQRPMSQNRKALRIIEEESGLKGLILRPLSAKFLPPTVPEKEGKVDRSALLSIKGRGRKVQLELARRYGIKEYFTPASGCLLTDKRFSDRLLDLFLFKGGKVDINDVELIKVGRIFRIGDKARLIVGRNEEENKRLKTLCKKGDFVLIVENVPGPLSIVRGIVDFSGLKLAASIIARYSDVNSRVQAKVIVYNHDFSNIITEITALPISNDLVEKLRV